LNFIYLFYFINSVLLGAWHNLRALGLLNKWSYVMIYGNTVSMYCGSCGVDVSIRWEDGAHVGQVSRHFEIVFGGGMV
jgi:hypothetical protein